MAGFKTWNIGDVLTASDLNNSFTNLPLRHAAITATYTAGAIGTNSTALVSIPFPTSRFSQSPIVTVSCNDRYLTAFISSINSGTVTVGLSNNGNASSNGTVVIYGLATQMTSGTAAG